MLTRDLWVIGTATARRYTRQHKRIKSWRRIIVTPVNNRRLQTALSFLGRRLWLVLSLCLILGLGTSGSVSANSGVSQGYTTSQDNLAPGTVMGLSPDTNIAVPATSNKSYQLLGLVANAPLIALNDGTHQVQIVISGGSGALVSDINGTIKAGDKVTSSPIVGVGMKATTAGQIIGTATADMSKADLTSETVTDKSGNKVTVHIGTVPLQVSVSYYTGPADQSELASILPPFLLHIANGIAGQNVSPLRVLIAILVLITGFAIAAYMLQAAIRSTIISVGRNPLAKNALRRELLDVSLTAIGILALTAVFIYTIVKI